ncbi:MAG TPA: helix-turn-helix transcriptional regulator [Bacteroidia bacterium]|jgi:transcriptional regulator with XRE-family HTH domain|nr:helix-turn-helix transcriptional regulator [Bacteroidia bacterium]
MSNNLNTRKLADMLKSKRGDVGLREIAKEIGGVSASTLSRIEQEHLPDIDTFLSICKWLEVSPEFFTEKKDEDASTANMVVAHLRADKTLHPDTARALIKMINLAYESTRPVSHGKRVAKR